MRDDDYGEDIRHYPDETCALIEDGAELVWAITRWEYEDGEVGAMRAVVAAWPSLRIGGVTLSLTPDQAEAIAKNATTATLADLRKAAIEEAETAENGWL